MTVPIPQALLQTYKTPMHRTKVLPNLSNGGTVIVGNGNSQYTDEQN